MKAYPSSTPAAVVLAFFVALGAWYSLAVPPFETPDEIYHYAFARHLAAGGGLPIQTEDANGPWAHEGTQAPLYYFLAGRLTAGIDQSDFAALGRENPHANLGNPQQPGNKNAMLYSAQARPLRGANLALHVGRWFSLALGALTLWLTYRTARLALPGNALPWLALATAAAIPQFAFISASFSNDSLVTCLAAGVVYWLARLVARDPERPVAAWEWLVLGILLGLASLSKLQALGLVGLALLAVLGMARQRRSARLPLIALPLMLGPLAAIAGWWYWRNHLLYGDWLGAGQLLSINGQRRSPLSWRGFVGEMRGLRYSFWGLFGWFSIMLPRPFYEILDWLSLAALAGLLARIVRAWPSENGRGLLRSLEAPENRVRLMLAAWALLVIGLMCYWATFATSSQGRLLFPALGALVTLLILGLSTWLDLLPSPRRMRTPRPQDAWGGRSHAGRGGSFVVLACLPVGLLSASIFTLGFLFPQSYGPLTAVAGLPADARPVGITINDTIDLAGVRLPGGRFSVGERVPVTLYLAARAPLRSDHPLFVQLLDDQGRVMGNITSHPGWGRFPTSLWQPGVLYEDRYEVLIESNESGGSPVLAEVHAGFMDPATLDRLPAVGADGEAGSETIGAVTVNPLEPPGHALEGLQPSGAVFNGGLRLVGFTYQTEGSREEGRLHVATLWEAAAAPGADYTVFIHLTGPDGTQISYDEPPAEGRLPTRLWQAGDRSLSECDLALTADMPPGDYRLWLGLYLSASGGAERLPVQTANQAVQDGAVLLGQVRIR